MHSLTLLDIIVILFVGGGALLGLMRGFVYGGAVAVRLGGRALIALKLFYAPAAVIIGTCLLYLRTRAGAGLLAFALVVRDRPSSPGG